MTEKIQGIFVILTLVLGATSFAFVNSPANPMLTPAFAVEVGAGMETEVEVEVESGDDSTEAKAKTEAKTEAEMKSHNEMESESEMESEIEIEVYVSGNKATITIEAKGEEKTYVMNTSSKAEIIAKIKSETSLTESEITSIWEYHESKTFESKSEMKKQAKMELEAEIQAKTTGITNLSLKAKERSKILVNSVEDKAEDTNKRFHAMMLKAKAKGYLNTETSTSSSAKTYSMQLNGMAKSATKADAAMEGTLYLESMKNIGSVIKYKVPAGKLSINGEAYDVLFGKARAISSTDAKVKTNMVLIAEVMKPNGEITTMKILLQSTGSLNNETDTSAWSVMNSKSKIAGEWSLDATGNMSLV
ncbi:MAG: hypothetical protein KJO99_05200 [Nitrosopumilus sp.]|nr:hypothetical protein [Nitrosopumilus sp.]NNL53389.1 hypothetical protein [Nitrosopumilus sp.]